MKHRLVTVIVLTLLLASTLILTFNITLMEAQAETTVSVSPSEIIGPPPHIGDNFWINITGENVNMSTPGDTIGMSLEWDPDVLTCTKIEVGDFFNGGEVGIPPFPWEKIFPGYIGTGWADLPSISRVEPNGPAGNGTLYTVEFDVVGFGSTDINITIPSLVHDGVEVPLIVNNGYFELEPSIHDVAVVNIVPIYRYPSGDWRVPTFAYTSYINPIEINVTVRNEGNLTETFDVTAYYNSTTIGSPQTVNNLAPGANTTLTFAWYVGNIYVPSVLETGTPYPSSPSFLISVNISSPVLGELQATDGYVQVRHAGDADADGKVYTLDFSNFILAYREGTRPDKPFNSPQCDFGGDGKVYTLDFWILMLNYRWGVNWF